MVGPPTFKSYKIYIYFFVNIIVGSRGGVHPKAGAAAAAGSRLFIRFMFQETGRKKEEPEKNCFFFFFLVIFQLSCLNS